MGKLEHPNIPTIYTIGSTPEGYTFYTMPVVQGKSLHEILEGLKKIVPKTSKRYEDEIERLERIEDAERETLQSFLQTFGEGEG